MNGVKYRFSHVPMTGQIPLFGGRRVKVGNRTGDVFEESPEAQAFSRWQMGEFHIIEREFASIWRRSLSTLDLDAISGSFREIGIGGESSRTLAEAKDVASRVVADPNKAQQLIVLALIFLGTSPQQRAIVLSQWRDSGSPPIASYAPYAAYVLTVEVFFQIAMAASLISTARRSNRVDIGYLFYLPFSMVFISSDGLHHRCAPLFLRSDQEFVWGADLKKDLARLNEHFVGLPEDTKEKGVFAFAATPPKDGDLLVSRLWDRHLLPWRDRSSEPVQRSPEQEAELIDQVKQVTKAPELPPDQVDFVPSDPDILSLDHRVRKRKGSWWQLPKDLPTDDEA